MSTAGIKRRPLLVRVISLEGAMAAFGLYSLGSGLWHGEPMPIFWGVTILVGLAVLVAVRRRDWQKHWQSPEGQSPARPPQDPGPPTA
jgi:hypothetical protein